MKWKQQGLWGLLSPELLKDNNSTLTLTDERGSDETLTRLDPSKAERILGVRLPMTDSMDAEYNFRKNTDENTGVKG